MRLAPVMLALLLALSPGAVAFHAAAPSAPASTENLSVVQSGTDSLSGAQSATGLRSGTQTNITLPERDGNTTSVMMLGTEPARTAFDRPSLALGSSLGADHDGFRTQLSVNTLDEELAATDNVENEKQILNRYRYQIENRIISLEAKERQRTLAFSNGSLSKSKYLRALGQIDSEVDEIQTLIDAMQTRAQSVRQFNMDTEASTLEGQLVNLDGPVRDRLGQIVRGQAPSTQVYVETAESGVVLSTIVGDTYVREIVRTDRYNPGASNQMSLQDVRQEIENQYSWTASNMESSGIDSKYGTTNVYEMWFDHSQGRLVVYYDGGTESVFKEVQHKQLVGSQSTPTGPSVTNSSANLTLTVNRAYSGGPLRVKLTNATGTPLQGEITVDGETIGRTSQNGILWTLGPVEQFQVNATYDDRAVNATVTPIDSS